jgi:superoxide dismutase, Fe-Mn family
MRFYDEQYRNVIVLILNQMLHDMKRIIFLSALIIGILPMAVGQPYTLPVLPYSYQSLEPHIDGKTMEIHHTKHHQAYVNNLNKAISGTPAEQSSLVDLMLNVSTRGDAIRNNGGGHYNHNLFWEILSPTPQKAPSGALSAAITASFGSLDSLQREINRAAMRQFGSGWAWLVVTPDRKLVVSSTPNQDNPLMDVAAVKGIPVLGIDVWEHAYYLHYQNRRGDYLGSIWNVIDWGVVSAKYDEAIASPLLKKLK